MISGACFCKAVQYELLTESQMQGLCYCTDCQVVGGSSHWASCGGALRLQIIERHSDSYTYDRAWAAEVTRHFCGTCSADHGAV